MTTIRDRLLSDDHRAYLQAVRELPTLPKDEAVNILWEIAQSNTSRTQARLMNPLRELAPELANTLALQILNDPNSRFHTDALYSLWKTESPMGVARASDMLLTHPNAIVRLWCATYLGTCGTSDQISILRQALGDDGSDEEGREVRNVAEASIAEIIEREGNS
jgi:HEAT repeat protein